MFKVITVCHDATHAKPLLDSLKRHQWSWTCIQTEWKGFGTKLIKTYEYLKANPEVDSFVFVDAFDVICLGSEGEFRDKLEANYPDADMVVSAERGLWPGILEPKRDLYTKHAHGFDYANSGCYYSTVEMFFLFIEVIRPKFEDDDQLLLNEFYLHQVGPKVYLDNSQSIFNSHSFIYEGEYGYENNRIQINGNEPLFIHKNGRSVDPKLDEMLKDII